MIHVLIVVILILYIGTQAKQKEISIEDAMKLYRVHLKSNNSPERENLKRSEINPLPAKLITQHVKILNRNTKFGCGEIKRKQNLTQFKPGTIKHNKIIIKESTHKPKILTERHNKQQNLSNNEQKNTKHKVSCNKKDVASKKQDERLHGDISEL